MQSIIHRSQTTIDLLGLRPEHVELISALLGSVILGKGDKYREAAFELSVFLSEQVGCDYDDAAELVGVEFVDQFGDGDISIRVSDISEDCCGACEGCSCED